jgi:hypothetical protein
VGIPADANKIMVTATEKLCFLCSPYLDVISRTEAEDIGGIHHQATTDEDIAD